MLYSWLDLVCDNCRSSEVQVQSMGGWTEETQAGTWDTRLAFFTNKADVMVRA